MFLLISDQLTCFTCDKSKSNDECNRKAIDEPCQQKLMNRLNSNFEIITNYSCLTVHKFDLTTKTTLSIEKKCSIDCKTNMVGCQLSSPLENSISGSKNLALTYRIQVNLKIRLFIF